MEKFKVFKVLHSKTKIDQYNIFSNTSTEEDNVVFYLTFVGEHELINYSQHKEYDLLKPYEFVAKQKFIQEFKNDPNMIDIIKNGNYKIVEMDLSKRELEASIIQRYETVLLDISNILYSFNFLSEINTKFIKDESKAAYYKNLIKYFYETFTNIDKIYELSINNAQTITTNI